MATLHIFSGLPGVGKTTLARHLAQELGAAYVRIDTIEQALRDLFAREEIEDEGYRLAYRIAQDNLRLGIPVVADACNAIEVTRAQWEQVAQKSGSRCVHIEVCCSDKAEHRRRIETRRSDLPGLVLPSWADVERREYHPWTRPRIVIDTAGKTTAESQTALGSALVRDGFRGRG
jgi:predicted kinase